MLKLINQFIAKGYTTIPLRSINDIIVTLCEGASNP